MSWKSLARSALLASVRAVTGRHAVLLPPDAADEASILDLSAPYRVDGDSVQVRIQDPGRGRLHMTLVGYEGHFPRKELWSAHSRYEEPQTLVLDLKSGDVRLGERNLGTVPLPIPTRRFCWRLELQGDSYTKRRLTSHYLATNGSISYFEGDNYVDYDEEAKADAAQVLTILSEHAAQGPLLEVGCATGLVLRAIADTGIECFGLDSSAWAVDKARARLGSGAVFRSDVERDPIPEEIRSRGPFGTLLLWTVLEHFRAPYEVLRKLTGLCLSGSRLFLRTTNAESLNRLLFASEWEGYFDATHYGVDAVSVERLRRELPELGWRICHLKTHLSWDSSVDPIHSTLREWWAADARFRRLLADLDRGDLVTLVAIKE